MKETTVEKAAEPHPDASTEETSEKKKKKKRSHSKSTSLDLQLPTVDSDQVVATGPGKSIRVLFNIE